MDSTTKATIDGIIAGLEPAGRPGIPPFGYGRDMACLDDLDPRMSETDPNTVGSLAQDIFHAVITERGQIIDAPDFGLGIGALLSAGRNGTELVSVGGRVDTEIMKDDRVSVSHTTATLEGRTLRLAISVEPEDPALRPFNLIMALTDAGALLEAMR